MKVTAVFVSSVDGKVTRGDEENIYSWTSPEDGKHFFSLIEHYSTILMGSNTYRAAKDKIKLSKEKLRIVLTHNPSNYKDEEIKGMLEFSDQNPSDVIRELEQKGCKNILFVGGQRIFQELLHDQLITELYLTLEPYIFGKGIPLVGNELLNSTLYLEEMKKLNERGTVLLKYKVTYT